MLISSSYLFQGILLSFLSILTIAFMLLVDSKICDLSRFSLVWSFPLYFCSLNMPQRNMAWRHLAFAVFKEHQEGFVHSFRAESFELDDSVR